MMFTYRLLQDLSGMPFMCADPHPLEVWVKHLHRQYSESVAVSHALRRTLPAKMKAAVYKLL